MAIRQGIRTYTLAKNPNARYKLKYTYNSGQIGTNGNITTKYSYSKLISSLTTKKYSYSK